MDNSTHNMSEQLVLYLDGALTGADKKAVEEWLASGATAQAEYESLLQTRAAIRHYGLKQKVGGIHGTMMEEMQPQLRKISQAKKILRYSMAAAASLILLIGGYMAYTFFTLSSGKVFSSNYRTYELSITRDDSNAGPTPAEKAYSEKNYKEVLRIHDAGEDKTAKGEFLCGTAALELKDNSKAIKCFNEVLDMNRQSATVALNDESEYYLALAYVSNKDYDFALPLLRKIKADEEHKYHSEISNRLIRQVKMLKWR
ncbi:MAG: hypothetical protein ACT4OJ_16230 [Bacteroidota bacterium]